MKRTNSTTYDETIIKLIEGEAQKSLFGAFAKKKHYTRNEILKGLRDEFDRF